MEMGVTSNCATASLYVSSVMRTMAACQNSLTHSFHNLGVRDVHGLTKTCLSKTERRCCKGTGSKRPSFVKAAEQ